MSVLQSIITEKCELDKRLTNLTNFVKGIQFYYLDINERNRLRIQHQIMIEYSDILKDRIAAFREDIPF